jgi:hypothetical protein
MKIHHKDTKGTKLKPIDTGDPNRHVFASIRGLKFGFVLVSFVSLW